MKLVSKFQGRSYDMMISHTTIVFTRYIMIEWLRRREKDQKTFGELFFLFCEDIQDMDLATALQNLMRLFVNLVDSITTTTTDLLKSQLQH